MVGKIFVNYRRGDDSGFALALFSQLELTFSSDKLFMDVEGGIAAGVDFVRVLERQIVESDVVLAVIGPGWLHVNDERGRRRLENPDDFVRVEIVSAIRAGKRVIPVLVNRAEMPRANELPEDMRVLSRLNAVRLTQERFKPDAQGLIKSVQLALAEIEADRHAATEAEKFEARQRQEEEDARRREAERLSLEAQKEKQLAGLTQQEIRKAEELANWDFIKAKGDEQELRDHLARFAGGVTEKYAREALETTVWKALDAQPTIHNLNAFLTEFPNGINSALAFRKREVLLRELEASKLDAERRRQETEAWAAASTATDVRVLQSFLDVWPNGAHAKSAKLRIWELRTRPFLPSIWQGAGAILSLFVLYFGLAWLFGDYSRQYGRISSDTAGIFAEPFGMELNLSLKSCQLLCLQERRCEAFMYNSASKACAIGAGLSSLYRVENYTVGVK